MIRKSGAYAILGTEECNQLNQDVSCNRWEDCCSRAPKCCSEQHSIYAFWYFWLGFAGSVLLLLALLICSSVVWCKRHHERRRLRSQNPFFGETVIRIQNMVTSRRVSNSDVHRLASDARPKSPLSTIREEGYITTRTEKPGGIIRPSVHGDFKWNPDKVTKSMGVLSAQTLRGMSPLDPAYPPANPIKLTRVQAGEVTSPLTYDDDYTEIVLPPGYVITPEKPFSIPPV